MQSALIVITGFMGSGKSTVARALALQLDSKIIDLDAEILRQEGRSAKQIIDEDGEPSFRAIETCVLLDVLRNNPTGVIALGGGAWTLPVNRNLITSAGGKSVWLDAPFDLCWQRIAASDDGRPLARNKLEALDRYVERRAAYAKANLHVEATGNKNANELALEIAKSLAMS